MSVKGIKQMIHRQVRLMAASMNSREFSSCKMVVVFVLLCLAKGTKEVSLLFLSLSLSILQMGENFAPKKKVLVAIHCQEIECFMPRQVGEGFYFIFYIDIEDMFCQSYF